MFSFGDLCLVALCAFALGASMVLAITEQMRAQASSDLAQAEKVMQEANYLIAAAKDV